MTTTKKHPVLDASELTSLGRQVVQLSKTAGLSMHEAAVTTLSPEHLSPAHIRRVCEIANTEAFNQKFASMNPAGSRYVSMDMGPADPNTVVQALTPEGLGTEDYSLGPVKMASEDFTVTPFRTRKGVVGDIVALQSKLAHQRELSLASAASAEFQMDQAFDKLSSDITRAELQGVPLQALVSVWERISPVGTKLAFRRLKKDLPSRVKVASASVDPQEPAVRSFREFVKTATAFAQHTKTRQELEEQLVEVGSWLTQRTA